MFSVKISILVLLIAVSSQASFEQVANRLDRGKISFSDYPAIIKNLVQSGFAYSAIPWAKEVLTSSSVVIDQNFDKTLDGLLEKVGTSQFETLPEDLLSRSSSNYILYTVAKKSFRQENYNKAQNYLKRISANSKVYSFALNMLGSISSIQGNQKLAQGYFKDCIDFSKDEAKQHKGRSQFQYLANKDYCVLGLARAQYAVKDFENAGLTYLDIPKSSRVWPEILYEEAWNSYYQGSYNRTLGKLVTYKAPIFEGFFNSDIEVLNALTYFKMCLFDDAEKIAEGFYKKYLNPATELRSFLLDRGNNFLYFYNLMAKYEDGENRNGSLLVKLLKSIEKEQAYQEIKSHLFTISSEYRNLRSQRNSRTRRILLRNTSEVLKYQKHILGSYIRMRLVSYYADIYKSFQNMSYIKLEILSQQKQKLYSAEVSSEGKRGDLKYLERNEKQYFWNFNGEFWSDELGDYVFALRNEC